MVFHYCAEILCQYINFTKEILSSHVSESNFRVSKLFLLFVGTYIYFKRDVYPRSYFSLFLSHLLFHLSYLSHNLLRIKDRKSSFRTMLLIIINPHFLDFIGLNYRAIGVTD